MDMERKRRTVLEHPDIPPGTTKEVALVLCQGADSKGEFRANYGLVKARTLLRLPQIYDAIDKLQMAGVLEACPGLGHGIWYRMPCVAGL